MKWTDVVTAMAACIAALGTAGSLIFLALQTRTLGRQTAELREQDKLQDDRRKAEFKSERTPIISVTPGPVTGPTNITVSGVTETHLVVRLNMYADGAGTAHNIILNFFELTDLPPWKTLATNVVRFMRAPDEMVAVVWCPPDTGSDETKQYRVEVSFLNMFEERIVFSNSAQFRHGRAGSECILQFTDAPRISWPWQTLVDRPA